MKLFFLLVLLLLASTVFPQTSLDSGPKVESVGLGATREEVIRRIGKPVSQSGRKADECVGGTEMTLVYPGLKFVLWDDAENPKKFTVGKFEVSGASWNISGAKIGQTETQIRKLFGNRTTQETGRAGQKVWFYEMDENKSPGSTSFTFRDGKLVRVTAMWLMC